MTARGTEDRPSTARGQPRLPALRLEDLDEATRAELEPRVASSPTANILLTLARHPELMRSWTPFVGYIFAESHLQPADVELIILRTTWLCQAEYEFSHHAVIAQRRGLATEDVDRCVEGAEAAGWSVRQRVLLRAVEALLAEDCIGDELWAELAGHYDSRQLMDIVFVCGGYRLAAMTLNALRVGLEASTPRHAAFASGATA